MGKLESDRPAEAMRSGLAPGIHDRMVSIRRELHRHPELAWKEEATARRIEDELDRLGVSHRRLCGTGVVADLPGAEEGPRVAVRADIDALPIAEDTGLPFASEIPGVMHACGHDGHTSMVLGAAELLVTGQPPRLPVRLVFQPAEETGTGARELIDGGVLEGVGMIFGGHLDVHYPAGRIFVTLGTVAASTDSFRIRMAGRGGHAGRPHEAADAIVAASHLVMALQHIVSRGVAPTQSAVISVGRFQAGEAPNAIAATAELEGTVRAFQPEIRQTLIEELRRVTRDVASLHRVTAEVTVDGGTPPVVNAWLATAIAREAAVGVVGEASVEVLPAINMAGEDFSYYQEHVPGCYVRFGARPASGEAHPNHSSRFDFDEEALVWGAAWYAEVARTAGRRLEGGTP